LDHLLSLITDSHQGGPILAPAQGVFSSRPHSVIVIGPTPSLRDSNAISPQSEAISLVRRI
jgi:hypothetical protein